MIKSEISAPKTYYEWVDVLDIVKSRSNDEAVLDAIQNGSIDWQTGVAERFINKLIDVVDGRMNSASDKFQNDMNHSKGEERAITQALHALRKEFRFLKKLVDIPAIPEDERTQCLKLVADQANEVQRALEDSARYDRSGKLASIVRNNRVNSL